MAKGYTDTPAYPVGALVRSKCGRDRKRIFVVTDIDVDNADAPIVIADGKLRKIEDRKHKNPAHLELVEVLGKSDTEWLLYDLTNGKIAEICEKHDFYSKK